MENKEIIVKYCPNCGGTVEPFQNFCKNCGSVLSVNNTPAIQYKNSKSLTGKIKNLTGKIDKKIIILVSILIGLTIFLLIVNSNSLNWNEECALTYTKELIDCMKDPDSFKLQSDIVYVKLSADNEDYNGKDVYFIEYSAKNGFGANVKSIACFFDGEYIDLDDTSSVSLDRSDYSSNEDYLNAVNSYINGPALAMSRYLSEWNLLGSNSDSFEESEIISAKKISKHAGCEYTKQ